MRFREIRSAEDIVELTEELAAKGADAIMSDYPDMVYDILGE